MRPIARWVVSRLRRYRPDHNPLRRRSDRIEAALAAAALAAVLFSVWPAALAAHTVYDAGVAAERVGPGARHLVEATLVGAAPIQAASAGAASTGAGSARAEFAEAGPVQAASAGAASIGTASVQVASAGAASARADSLEAASAGESLAVPAGGRGVPVASSVRWTLPSGEVREGVVPVALILRDGPANARLWVDAEGRPAAPPPHRAETVTRAVLAAAGVVASVAVLAWACFALARRRLDRRRYREWEAAWAVADRRWRRHQI
ncbi:hypothetical protein OHB01_33565 [Microbispora hainanensis]|uniref:Uncharacterized protein n=1 Tax=Microbispora hainanensis TaxID=568844 RepID=A0ABZ1SWW9_9ACTN|nr:MULTISPECIES: hypothetical protein [Microbispora]NJP24979.1 hypothetical protein [Microbispora sp. CL1-1]